MTEAGTASAAHVPRGLSLPGRRRRAAGERVAALFGEHGRMVYGTSLLLLRDPVEAEDAAQQTFLSAYRALLAGQQPRDPSAWLGTIARNECRSRLRVRQTEPLALAQEPTGDELQRDLSRREEIHALCAALTELPPQQRDALVLREFYGFSYAEVAAALGLSGAAVESLLFRGRKHLQEQLRPLRSALGVLTLPVTVRESLAQALPGFGGGAASAGAGSTVLAKLASVPLTAKLAAATLAVGTVGTVARVEQPGHPVRHRPSAPERVRAVARTRAEPIPVAARTEPATGRPVATQRVSLRITRARTPSPTTAGAREAGHEGMSGRGGSELEPEPHSAPVTAGTAGASGAVSGGSGGSGHDSGGTSLDGGSGSGGSSSDGSGSHDSGSGGSGSSGSADLGATGTSGHDGSGSGS